MTKHATESAAATSPKPLLKTFSPPGLLTDVTTPAALRTWSDTISGFCEDAKTRVDAYLHGKPRQFFNPTRDAFDATDRAELPILWQGFPKSIEREHGENTKEAWRAAERISGTHVARMQFQDEYLEWHVTRDSKKRIIRVDFTCEGPEYWSFLAETDPDAVVALYQKHVSPKVKKSELFHNDQYNPHNPWNVAHGAMHLIQPSNTLSAEVFLAALFVSYQASIQNQFQFLMSQWVTGKDKPRVGGGTDSVLGDQSLGPCIVRGAQGQREAVQLARFISPRAGAYFFAPSLRALREHLSV